MTRARTRDPARPTTLRTADAAGEALACIAARPAGAVLTCLPILLAAGWLVAVLGLITTADAQVSAAFAARLATVVRVSQVAAGPAPAPDPYPAGVLRRLGALPGVLADGAYWRVSPAPGPVLAAGDRAAGAPAVLAATPGFLSATRVRIASGRRYGPWAEAHAAQVCLLGPLAARALGIGTVRGQPAILVGGEPCAVQGVIAARPARPALADAVLLPASAATRLFGPPGRSPHERPELLIRTRPGAALAVARQAPYVISPTRPRRFAAAVRRYPQGLRDQVAAVLGRLFTLAAWAGLAAGLLAVAVVGSLSVAGRAPEYALRRALGARRRHVLAHAACESGLIGLIGGLAGASLGVAAVVLVARARGWVPVMAPLTVLAAPPAAACATALAGLIPAGRAALIQPGLALPRLTP